MNLFLEKIDIKLFFEEYYGKKIYFEKRNNANYYSDIITSEEINQFFEKGDLSIHKIGVYQNNLPLQLRSYSQLGKIDSIYNPTNLSREKLTTFYDKGGTVSVKEPELSFPLINSFLTKLSESLNTNISANLLLMNKNGEFTQKIYPNHSQFIIVLHGSVEWRLTQFKAVDSTQVIDPPIEISLQSGDLLYLPDGFECKSNCSSKSLCLLQITLELPTWKNAISTIILNLKEQIEFRDLIHLSTNKEYDFKLRKEKYLEIAKQEKLQSHKIIPTSTSKWLKNYLFIDEISNQSVVQVNRQIGVLSTKTGDDSVILFSKEIELEYPIYLEEMLNFICTSLAPFRVNQLPGNENDLKTDLVCELVEEQILTIVEI